MLTYPDIDPVLLRLDPLELRWYGIAYVAVLLCGWIFLRWCYRKHFRWPAALWADLLFCGVLGVFLWERLGAMLFDPVLIILGPFILHWYSIAYIVALGSGWVFLQWRYQKHLQWPAALWADLLFYSTLGVVLGGRLGSMLFYHSSYLLQDPLELFRIWNGGMSLHGGVVGVVVALWLLARRHNLSLLRLGDMVVLVVPFGLFLGRLANFVNGELWGRPTTLPWGMVFPDVDNLPRHPSQLYQALLEGAFLFVALNFYARRPRPAGSVAGYFLVGYAALRILAEQWREPNAHIGFVVSSWTLGQLLSLPMVGFGLFLIYWSRRHAADSEKASKGGD